jgi:hypothetical protein
MSDPGVKIHVTKVEYLYINLGSLGGSFLYTPNAAFTYTESSTIHNHVARLGLNYKFGGP